MLRRLSLGLVLSVLAHAGIVGLGLALGARGLGGPVDIELTDARVTELKDFPLGAPESGTHAKPRAHARARSHAPAAPETGTLASRAGDEKPQAGSSPKEDEAAPAPTSDLGAYGPEGSLFAALIRLDRLRGTDYQSPVDALLLHLPDRRELLTGTGLSLFDDFDAVLIATPNVLDPSVTFLAVRHHLELAAMRAALTRGARAGDRTLAWRSQQGRFVGEWRARKDVEAAAVAPRRPDDRIVVLADPGLAIVTPPAYGKLLLGSDRPPAAPAAAAGEDDGAPDGGAEGASRIGTWANLLGRIDAEEGLVPPDGIVMLKVVDVVKTRGLPPGQASPTIYGLEIPPTASAVIGIDDGPFLDLDATFAAEAAARHWEVEWPGLQRKLRSHPYALLSGFSTLIGRATLTREENVVHFHLSLTREETLRLLALAQQMLIGRGL
jgi:hypothetical protein